MDVIFSRTDTPAEVELVKSFAKQNGAYDAVICSHWAKGGQGAADLASAVEAATSQPSNFKFLYDVKVGQSGSLRSRKSYLISSKEKAHIHTEMYKPNTCTNNGYKYWDNFQMLCEY